MKRSLRSLMPFVFWGVGGFLLWRVLKQINITAILDAVSGAGRWEIALIAFFPFVTFGIAALRWSVALRALEVKGMRFRTLLAYMFSGAAISIILPSASVSGDSSRALFLTRENVPAAKAAASIGADYFVRLAVNTIMTSALLLAAIALGFFTFGRFGNLLAALFIFLGLLGIYLLRFIFIKDGILVRFAAKIAPPELIADRIAEFNRELTHMFPEHPATFWKMSGISLVGYFWEAVQTWLFFGFLGTRLSMADFFLWHNVVAFAHILPAPSGLGFVETSGVALAEFIGKTAALGIGVVVLGRIRDLMTLVVGVSVLIWQQFRAFALRSRIPAA